MPELTCPSCGAARPDLAGPCPACGYELAATGRIPIPDQHDEADSDSVVDLGVDLTQLREGTAMLLVHEGPGAGSRFLLDADEVVAGRSPECDIILDDVTVSRRHAQFRREGATFRVSDLGSLNGTYLNRAPLDTALLEDGDEVRVGKYRLIFRALGAVDG